MKKITIKTKHFGETTINEDQIINFPNGILAFEEYSEYAIISEDENSIFHWLQSTQDPDLAFLIMEPYFAKVDYVPDIYAYQLENLMGSTSLEHLSIWCIVTIPPNHPEKMTINLQGPLIISSEKKLGGQFISNNEAHHVRMPVLELVEAGEIA